MPMKSLFALALSTVTLVLLWYLFLQPEPPPPRALPSETSEASEGDYPLRDWGAQRSEKLNISLFTFNDRNRNGLYDLGDSPLASIVVRVARPDGTVVATRSNINGYANFGMLFQNDSADINLGGEYLFTVSVPPAWQLSTANAEQLVRFSERSGSPSGLIAVNPPAVVGLTQQLDVTGRLKGEPGQQLRLNATGPDDVTRALELGDDGSFAFAGQPGEWLLTASDDVSGKQRQRGFTLSNAPLQLSVTDFAKSSEAPLPFPMVEDFEGRYSAPLEKLPRGWSGLGWDFLIAVDNQFYVGPGYVNGLRSGMMVGYNSSGHPVTITPDAGEESFDFVGGYFSAAWPSAHGEQLKVQAWRKGRLVGEEDINLSYLGPVWLQADYHRIDRLVLSTAHYWQFVTDDMAFRLASAPDH